MHPNSSLHSHATSPVPLLYIPVEAAYLTFISAILISIVGLVGNLITIAALVKFSARLNSQATTKFVINLAITDLLFCALVLPINSGRFLTRSWPFGHFLCRAYPLIYYGTVATSLLLITVITINRLILIAFNDHYSRIYTPSKVNLMILFCWVFSYGIMLAPTLDLWGHTGLNSATFSCTILRDRHNRSPKKFLFSLAFLLPMSVIVVCYSIIFTHVQRQGKKKSKIRTSKRDLRLTMLISVVFGTFLLCFLPLFVGNVIIPDDRFPYFHVLASIFAWLNSCINPFIYFALNPRYRSAFKRLFKIKSSYSVTAGNGSNVGGTGDLSTSEQQRSVKWTSSKKTVIS